MNISRLARSVITSFSDLDWTAAEFTCARSPSPGDPVRVVEEQRFMHRPHHSLLSSPSFPTLVCATMAQVIVVGGGLAGLSAAHTLLERGANVLLLDKQP